MPSYVVNLQHFVWSTEHRRPLIDSAWQDRLYGFFGGIARNHQSVLIAAGGMPDHMHLLVSLHPTMAIATMVNTLKSNATRWIHKEFPRLQQFCWQENTVPLASVNHSSKSLLTIFIVRPNIIDSEPFKRSFARFSSVINCRMMSNTFGNDFCRPYGPLVWRWMFSRTCRSGLLPTGPTDRMTEYKRQLPSSDTCH